MMHRCLRYYSPQKATETRSLFFFLVISSEKKIKKKGKKEERETTCLFLSSLFLLLSFFFFYRNRQLELFFFTGVLILPRASPSSPSTPPKAIPPCSPVRWRAGPTNLRAAANFTTRGCLRVKRNRDHNGGFSRGKGSGERGKVL